MQIHYTFKNSRSSKKLVKYTEDHLAKLLNYETKPVDDAYLMYRSLKSGFEVELKIVGPEISLKAHGEGDNFYEAVDQAIQRLKKQMSRRKSRIQYHKNPDESHMGKLKRMTGSLEYRSPKLQRIQRKAG